MFVELCVIFLCVGSLLCRERFKSRSLLIKESKTNIWVIAELRIHLIPVKVTGL